MVLLVSGESRLSLAVGGSDPHVSSPLPGTSGIAGHVLEGVQGRLHQNVPLCHVDYFKLKIIGAQQTQEELFTSTLAAGKNLDRGLVPGRELLPEITFYIWKTYLHGVANICLPNICFSHLPVNCLPPL